MSLSAYNFPASQAAPATPLLSGFAPFTISFQPSAINFGDNVVGKITYAINGTNYTYSASATRYFTYSTLADALSGATQDIDCRSNFVYTFYNTVSAGVPQTSTTSVTVSALLFPSLQTVAYNIQVQTNTPWLTQNPLSAGQPSIYNTINLLKSRSWDSDNKQIIAVEGVGTSNSLFFVNTSDNSSLSAYPSWVPTSSTSQQVKLVTYKISLGATTTT